MVHPVIDAQFISIWNRLVYEARITYGLVWRDLSASLIPATLMALAASHTTSSLSLTSAPILIGSCLLYFGLYIYGFCLCNQIVGVEEDRANKPDRVIPSGMLSLHGAKQRLAFALIAFPVAAYALGGDQLLVFALAWQMIFLAYNLLGLHLHWSTKNIVFIGLGTIVLLAPAWLLGGPLHSEAWRWVLVVSIAFAATLHLQDLRDTDGDRLVGRQTLPIAVGMFRARVLIALAIASLPIAIHFTLFQFPSSTTSITTELVLGATNLLVALRTLLMRNPKADHKTYMLHTYWFCMVVASAGLVL